MMDYRVPRLAPYPTLARCRTMVAIAGLALFSFAALRADDSAPPAPPPAPAPLSAREVMLLEEINELRGRLEALEAKVSGGAAALPAPSLPAAATLSTNTPAANMPSANTPPPPQSY